MQRTAGKSASFFHRARLLGPGRSFYCNNLKTPASAFLRKAVRCEPLAGDSRHADFNVEAARGMRAGACLPPLPPPFRQKLERRKNRGVSKSFDFKLKSQKQLLIQVYSRFKKRLLTPSPAVVWGKRRLLPLQHHRCTYPRHV